MGFSNSFNNLLVLETNSDSNHVEALLQYLLDLAEEENDRFFDGKCSLKKENLLRLKASIYTRTVLFELAKNIFNTYVNINGEDLSIRSNLQALKKRFDAITNSKTIPKSKTK